MTGQHGLFDGPVIRSPDDLSDTFRSIIGLPPHEPAGLTIVVYGQPAPQGSKRHVGRGIMVESSKALKPWREAVKFAALDALPREHDTNATLPPLDGPLVARMVFTLRKPSSAPKRRRTWPDRTPDLSKLVRATEDALTDAGVWADDARVVELYAAKRYPGEGDDALDRPGARITIQPLGSTPPTDTWWTRYGDQVRSSAAAACPVHPMGTACPSVPEMCGDRRCTCCDRAVTGGPR